MQFRVLNTPSLRAVTISPIMVEYADEPLMSSVNLHVVDAIYLQRKMFVTGVKRKATGDSKHTDSLL